MAGQWGQAGLGEVEDQAAPGLAVPEQVGSAPALGDKNPEACVTGSDTVGSSAAPTSAPSPKGVAG
eukprot:1145054-Pelagomonas_calceolata.AAC.1